MNKLKPVPDRNIIKQGSSFIEINGELSMGEVEIDLAIKQNEILEYLDYLREHIQDLEDMRHD